MGVEPTFSKSERFRGCEPFVSQLSCGGSPFYLIAICALIVSHFKGFVKRFFELFSFGREILFYFTQLRIGERLFAPVCLFTSLLYHNLGDLSRGFPNFFYFLFWNRLRWATLTVDSVSPNPLVVSKPNGSRGD